MDTIQMVNESIQSANMNITPVIEIFSSVVIAIAAVAMYWNARSIRKLEETSIKIALWPEIKKLIKTIDNYTFFAHDKNPIDSNSEQIFRDYLTVTYFAQFIFREGDELLNHLMQLKDIGNNLRALLMSKKSGESKEWDSEIHKNKNLFYDKSNEIKRLLQKRYNLAITTN